MKRKVQIFRAIRGTKSVAWALSEENLRDILPLNFPLATNAQECQIVSEVTDVDEVDGILYDWNESGNGGPRFHVHWRCPACGLEQTTDIEQDETIPQLWGCGNPKCLEDLCFLVRW